MDMDAEEFVDHPSNEEESVSNEDVKNSSGSSSKEAVTCQTCLREFKSVQYLKAHLKHGHNETVSICEICSKEFEKPLFLRNHIRNVHTDRLFSCPDCDHVCKTKYGMKLHVESKHLGKRDFTCSFCGSTFSDYSSWKSHEKYMHPTQEVADSLKCKECGYQFHHPRNFKRHMILHKQPESGSGDRGDRVQKKYSNEVKVEALRLAKAVGSTEACERLNISYSCLRNWIDATKPQTNDYYCEHCDKYFKTKAKLDDHTRVRHNSNGRSMGRGYRYTDEFRHEVADYVKTHSKQEAMEHYGLSESTVRGIVKKIMNPEVCTECGRTYQEAAKLRKHMEEAHKVGAGYAPLQKEASLSDFLESRNISAEELHVSKEHKNKMHKEAAEANNIQVYNPEPLPKGPTANPKPKPKEKKPSKKKRVKSKESFKDNVKEEEGDVEVKTPSKVKEEEVKIEMSLDDIKVEDEDFDDTTADFDNDIGDDDDDDNNDNGNDQGSDSDEEVNDDDLEKMESGDFGTLMSILGDMRSNDGGSEVKTENETKVERKSLDEEDDDEFDENDVPDFGEEEDEEISEKEATKIDVVKAEDAAEEEKPSVKVTISKKEKKTKKLKKKREIKEKKMVDGRVKKKNPTVEMLPHDKIDFSIDLKSYGINEEDETFYVQSNYLHDINFMSVVRSKMYRHKPKSFQCSECQKLFTTLCDLKRHMSVHSNEQNFGCELCKKKFKTQPILRRHMQRRHNDDLPLEERGKEETPEMKTCIHCGAGFKSNQALRLHEARHIDDKPYKCDECDKTYTASTSLEYHKNMVHRGAQVALKYMCNLCGKQFPRKGKLEIHQRTHMKGANVTCDLCGKTFKQPEYLQNHKRYKCKNNEIEVQNKKRYACNVCGNDYAEQRSLITHMRIVHDGITDQFECDHCGQKFSRKTSLWAHKKLHTGDHKMYNCDNCSFSSKDKRYFVNHQLKCSRNSL